MRWTTVAVATGWAGSIASVAYCVFAIPGAVTPLFIVTVAFGFVPLVFAIVVDRRRPGHPAAALLAAAGAGLLVPAALPTDVPSPFAGTWMLLYLPYAILLLVVPDSRPPSPRWRFVGPTITSVVGAFILANLGQWALPEWETAFMVASLVPLAAFLLLLFVCVAAPIARYRSADEETRLRLRWVFLAGSSLPLTLLLCWASYLVLGTPELVGVGLAVMYLAIPAGVTIALVRPDVVDIDRALVASVAVGALAVAVMVVLSVASAISTTPFSAWPPIPLIAVSVGLTLAVVFGYPFVRRGFDRVIYPERDRGLAAVRRLATEVDAGAATPEMLEEVLQGALRDPGLQVCYRRLSDGELVGLDGRPCRDRALQAAVRLRGEEIGAFVASPAQVKPPPAAVAHAAAPLVDAIRLRGELSLAMAEVEASRSRILRAGYDERRRLERDLHDGAQQRLVALGMRLRVLQRTSPTDGVLSATLDTAVAELGTAVAELRQIAHGVRPSALDDGLAPALAGLTRLAPDAIELDVKADDLPDDVATTAYFVASEAVTNALRHAEASRIRVDVTMDASALRLTVVDDGRGGAVLRTAGGLTGLVDRVEALGGTLSIDSASGRGTTVEAVLPCGS